MIRVTNGDPTSRHGLNSSPLNGLKLSMQPNQPRKAKPIRPLSSISSNFSVSTLSRLSSSWERVSNSWCQPYHWPQSCPFVKGSKPF
jgi:hypothetical protein